MVHCSRTSRYNLTISQAIETHAITITSVYFSGKFQSLYRRTLTENQDCLNVLQANWPSSRVNHYRSDRRSSILKSIKHI